MGRGHDARGHADEHRHQQGAGHQHQRRLGALDDRGDHRPVEEVGLAEVAPQHAGVEAQELLVERPIEPERPPRGVDLGRGRVGAQHHAHRIPGDQVDEQEHDRHHHRHHRDDGEEAPD